MTYIKSPIYCKELDQQFSTHKELFSALKERKDELIALKRSTVKRSDSIIWRPKGNGAAKEEPGYRRLAIGDTVENVVNTTNYIDSHLDLHLPSIWNKSVKEQQGKTFHTINHDLELGKIVGWPNAVGLEVKSIPWRELNYDIDGDTEALVGHTRITDKTNVDAFKAYRDGEPVQHSIRMEYVKLLLAVNDPEMKDEYANWTKYIEQAINPEVAEESGYFWPVLEAKISKEFATVLFGSNDVTPYRGFKTSTQTAPLKNTPDPEPHGEQFDIAKAIENINFF